MFRIRFRDDTAARSALPDYFAIFEGIKKPRYLLSKKLYVNADLNRDTDDALWNLHDTFIKGGVEVYSKSAENTLLDLKIELAKRLMSKCSFCERRCGANRLAGKKGHCGVIDSKIASEFIHWGEEPELIPSYTIFFSGCTFNCVYCQNWDISQFPDAGTKVNERTVANWIERRTCRNTNWVGGDPTPNLLYILKILKHCTANLPQVWNSNMYLTVDSMKLLQNIIDLYLTDFKYGNDSCAKRLSNVRNYWQITCRNHIIANNQCEVIIRHLVLPHHFECCSKPILRWIAENLNLKKVRVNIMAQYRPEYEAYKYEDLKRRLKADEFKKAYQLGEDLGLSLVD
jgi:putative pyruvate formate lyase activating enzyme